MINTRAEARSLAYTILNNNIENKNWQMSSITVPHSI